MTLPQTKSGRGGVLVLAAAALLIGSLLTRRAAAFVILPPSEQWSQSLTPGLASQNQFVMVFSGDQTGNIPAQTEASYDNPFSSPTINVAYNSGLNQTFVTFSGSNSISNSSAVQVGLSNLNEGIMATETGAYWENTSNSSTTDAPVLQISPTTTASGGGYAVVYLDYDPPATPQPSYYEFAYDLPLPPLDLTNPNNSMNDTTESFNLSSAGYILSPTLIPLDDLNFSSEPPPGQFGSMFNPIPFPGSLSPGGSEDISLPEPSSMVLFCIGGAALALAFARRRLVRTRFQGATVSG